MKIERSLALDTRKENKESSIISSAFKNTENLKDKPEDKSKENFDKLFEYLIGFKHTDA